MGSLSDENIHAKREIVILELIKGQQMAAQLQALLEKPVNDDDGLVSVEDLALQILRSFTDSLFVLSESSAAVSTAAVDGGCRRNMTAGVKDRRGSYKRRRTSDSWMKTSPVMEDGYAWRKYGQKVILNSDYPRCYFRCTHKHEEGCKAIKQVQIIKENPVLYQTTYFNHHTCNTPIRAPPLNVGLNPVEPNLLSFQTSNQSQEQEDQYPTSPMIMVKKEESKQDTPISSEDDAKSSLDQWLDFIGSESFGYKPNWPPLMGSNQEEGFHSSGPISLNGLEMDVNQFGDKENIHFD